MRLLIAALLVFSCSSFAQEPAVEKAAGSEAKVESTALPAAATTTDESKIAAPDTRAESEIPLNLDAEKKANADGSSLFRILFSLAMLGLVGTGAFIFLKKYAVPKAMKSQTQIKVLQQHYLGPKKSLAIVRVAGESILIGITDQNISMIKSLSLLDDEVPEEIPQNFDQAIEDFNNDEDEAPRKNQKKSAKQMDADDEFAISGIKDVVSKRLKGMRSFQ